MRRVDRRVKSASNLRNQTRRERPPLLYEREREAREQQSVASEAECLPEDAEGRSWCTRRCPQLQWCTVPWYAVREHVSKHLIAERTATDLENVRKRKKG